MGKKILAVHFRYLLSLVCAQDNPKIFNIEYFV